jgi:gas vesicle protein
MPPAEPSLMLYLLSGGIAGLIVGLLTGFGLGRSRSVKLRHELDLRNVEIKNQKHLDTEREQALALAAERLSSAFSQRANEQLQSHSETFLKLAKESLGIHLERAKAELASREQAVENLVKPTRDALSRTEAHISSMEKTRHEAHGSITRNWRPWRPARRRSALRHAIWLTRSSSRSAGRCPAPAGYSRHADELRPVTEGDRVWLASDRAGGERRRNSWAGGTAVRTPECLRRSSEHDG